MMQPMDNLPKAPLVFAVLWYAAGIVGLTATAVVLVARWLQGVLGLG